MIDLRQAHGETGTWLSPPLREALATTLVSGEQAMLFLNRRGYAPLTLCEACGHKMICRNCSAWLVEHRYHRKLVCHHCGFGMPTPAELSALQCGENACRLRARCRARGGGIQEHFSGRAHGDCFQRHHARPRRNAGRHPRHGETRDRCADRHADRGQGPSFPATHFGGRHRCRSRWLRRRSALARTHLPDAASGVRPRRPRRAAGTGADPDAQSGRRRDAGAGQRRPQCLS